MLAEYGEGEKDLSRYSWVTNVEDATEEAGLYFTVVLSNRKKVGLRSDPINLDIVMYWSVCEI